MKTLLGLCALSLLTSCSFVDSLEQKAEAISSYEVKALHLAKQNRALTVKIGELQAEIQKLKSQNNYLTLKLDDKSKTVAPVRSIASVPPRSKDAVKFGVYKWTPTELAAMANREFGKENFEQSAQYYYAFMNNYAGHNFIDDNFLYQAGVAAYESGKHPEWVKSCLAKLINDYPTSKHYRGAKLFMALNDLKQGNQADFFKTVEEFRLKYRNTPEWKILSVHYEDIVQQYKD